MSGAVPCHKKNTVSESFLSQLKHFLRLLFFSGLGGCQSLTGQLSAVKDSDNEILVKFFKNSLVDIDKIWHG